MKLRIITGIGVWFVVMIAVGMTACQSDEQLEFKHYYSGGSVLYQNNCQNCHGAHGEGLGELIPPLTDSLYLKSTKASLTCTIRYGLKGKVKLSNKTFEGEMPPIHDLAPIEVAMILTYITNSFGNNIGIINVQEVENDLRECK